MRTCIPEPHKRCRGAALAAKVVVDKAGAAAKVVGPTRVEVRPRAVGKAVVTAKVVDKAAVEAKVEVRARSRCLIHR